MLFRILRSLFIAAIFMVVFLNTVWHPRSSFIYSIKTTSYSSQYLKKILDNFNEMGDNSIVSYTGTRPILIEEVSDMKITDSGYEIGNAEVSPAYCKIKLIANMVDWQLKDTLLHEYLHCMWYDHSKDKNDLMATHLNTPATEQNIRKYAIELKRRFHGNTR